MATACDPPPPLTVTEANFAPSDVGLNTTEIVHFAPTAKLAPHVLVFEYWLAPAPVRVMLVIDSVTAPVLVTVTTCARLDSSSGWFPKLS
jgi:hypothetical protein